MAFLERESWPGNVRELSHRLEAALVLSGGGKLGVEALQAARGFDSIASTASREMPAFESGEGFPDPRSVALPEGSAEEPRRYAFMGEPEEEKEHIWETLTRCKGNKSRTARELGMARNTLRARLQRYGLG